MTSAVYTDLNPVAGLEEAVRGLARGSRERQEAVVSFLRSLPPDLQDEAYHGGIGIGLIRSDERLDLWFRRELKSGGIDHAN